MARSKWKRGRTAPTLCADVRRFSQLNNADKVFGTHKSTPSPQENNWRQYKDRAMPIFFQNQFRHLRDQNASRRSIAKTTNCRSDRSHLSTEDASAGSNQRSGPCTRHAFARAARTAQFPPANPAVEYRDRGVQLDSVFDIGRRDRISGTTGEQCRWVFAKGERTYHRSISPSTHSTNFLAGSLR